MIRELFLEDLSLWSCIWQSTLFAAIGLIGSFLLRRRPARASQVLFLGMIAAVLVPAMSVAVKHFEWGLFAVEPNTFGPELLNEMPIGQYEPSVDVSGPEVDIRPVESVLAETSSNSIKITCIVLMIRLSIIIIIILRNDIKSYNK